MPKIGSEIEIDETFLNKYPADVSRLVAITPHLRTQHINQQRLEKIAEDILAEYQHLQTLLEHISVLLHGPRHTEKHKAENQDNNKTDRQFKRRKTDKDDSGYRQYQ